MKVTITLDTDGPKTREEVFDAIKAYAIIRGAEPQFMDVPMATYRAWTEWSDDAKGRIAGGPDPITMDRVSERLFGLRISITDRYKMY